MKIRLLPLFATLFLTISSSIVIAQEAAVITANEAQKIVNTSVAGALPATNNSQGVGKLIVSIEEFTSEITLKSKVETTLKSGGLEWGAKNGQVVFTMVNKRFVNFDMPNFTRYASKTEIELPAGDYSITGIGLHMSTAFSPEKILNKGAFINNDVFSFKLEAGKIVTVKIRPVIKKDATFFLNFFVPDLMTSIDENGTYGEEKNMVAKTDASLPWATYTGPLKFQVSK
jgi:hypothetical protein